MPMPDITMEGRWITLIFRGIKWKFRTLGALERWSKVVGNRVHRS